MSRVRLGVCGCSYCRRKAFGKHLIKTMTSAPNAITPCCLLLSFVRPSCTAYISDTDTLTWFLFLLNRQHTEGRYDNCFIRATPSLEAYLWFELLTASAVSYIFKRSTNNNVEKIHTRQAIAFDRPGNLFSQ